MPRGVPGSARLKQAERAAAAERKKESTVIITSENMVEWALKRAYSMNKQSARIILENAKQDIKWKKEDFAHSDRVVNTIKRLEDKLDGEIRRLALSR
jgi:hypothetical protein